LAAINCLAVLKSLISDWSQVKRIIKINGFINSAPGFYEQPQVLNGASDLVVEVWGEIGQHARAAVGVSDLPLNAPCEIDMIIQVQ
jgi:enamine deaminase RidA (YjgF/YER057c/UK114 family)